MWRKKKRKCVVGYAVYMYSYIWEREKVKTTIHPEFNLDFHFIKERKVLQKYSDEELNSLLISSNGYDLVTKYTTMP